MTTTPTPFDRLYALRAQNGTLVGLYDKATAQSIQARNPSDRIKAYSSTPARPDTAPEFAIFVPGGGEHDGYQTPGKTRAEARDGSHNPNGVVAQVYPVPTCALWGDTPAVFTGIRDADGKPIFLLRPTTPLLDSEAARVMAHWDGMAAAAALALPLLAGSRARTLFFIQLAAQAEQVVQDTIAAIAPYAAAPDAPLLEYAFLGENGPEPRFYHPTPAS